MSIARKRIRIPIAAGALLLLSIAVLARSS
jgi:hypothetical protein